MSLTEQDLSEVKEIVVGAIVEAIDTMVSPRFDILEADVAVLKTDVAVLKTDVAVLKSDVSTLKTDVAVLKSDVSTLKTEMREVKQILHTMDGRMEALENDVRELYGMVADLQKAKKENHKFNKLPLEKKILQTHAELLLVAKEAGVVLPNNS